jgi:hypothetical protein
MPTTPKLLTQAQYQALVTAIPKYCTSTVFSIAGQTFTATQAVALVQLLLNASAATAAAKAARKEAIAAEQATIAQNVQLVRGIRESLELTYSNSPTMLAAFDIQPRKSPKPLSTEARVAASAKAKATRAARGTTSRKEKAAITGNVAGVTITPVMKFTASTSSAPGASTSSTPAALAPSVAAVGQLAVGTVVTAGAGGSSPHA